MSETAGAKSLVASRGFHEPGFRYLSVHFLHGFVVSANLRNTCWSFLGEHGSLRKTSTNAQQIAKSWLAKFPSCIRRLGTRSDHFSTSPKPLETTSSLAQSLCTMKCFPNSFSDPPKSLLEGTLSGPPPAPSRSPPDKLPPRPAPPRPAPPRPAPPRPAQTYDVPSAYLPSVGGSRGEGGGRRVVGSHQGEEGQEREGGREQQGNFEIMGVGSGL